MPEALSLKIETRQECPALSTSIHMVRDSPIRAIRQPKGPRTGENKVSITTDVMTVYLENAKIL